MLLDSWAKFIKMNRRVLIRDLNPSLVCFFCKGYYIDATTILECNHAFCRTCIFKHVEGSRYCPICDVLVHECEPVLGLKRDKTLQDIVYKLVPGLYENEMKQRREFYQRTKVPRHYINDDDFESGGDVSEERKFHVADDSIIVSLSYFQSDIKPWYVRCPVGVSIGHLKKLITCKSGFDSSKVEVEILLQSRILDPELTLLDIACLSPYRNKDSLEFSFVMLDMKTMTEAVEKDKNLGAESTCGKASGSVVESKVVEKEVQLQITETGIMSVSDVDIFLSDVMESASNVTVAATVVPTSSSVTLTSATPARPTTATVPPTPSALPVTKGMKRLSVDLRDLSDQKKSKRADEVRPKRPSLEEGEMKAKRADDVRPKRSSLAESEVKAKRADDVRPKRSTLAESEVKAKRADDVRPKRSSLAESEVKAKRADDVRPKRSSLAESEVNAKRSPVEDREKKGDGVEENGREDSVDGNSNRPVEDKGKSSKRPSIEDSDKNGKKSLQEREKNASIPSTTEKTAKRPSVEDQEKKSKTLPANETSRKTRNSSGEGSSNSQKGPSSNIPTSSAGLIAASMNHRQGDGRKAQDKLSEDKSDGVATSFSNSKNPPIASQSPVRTTPAPSKKPPVPEAISKEANSSSHAPEMDAVASSSYPNDKSDKTAAQKSPKNQTLRSGPDPWRPVITKETLRPKLLSNSDEAKKPAKFFKHRNVPIHSELSIFLGNPTTGVKRMYSNGMTAPKTPPKKPEPIVRMDPKTMLTLPMEREAKKSPSMVMTSPFIPRDNKVMLPDPKTQPFSHMSSPGFHASLPPSIQLLLNPQQHFRNLNKTREEAASSKHCDTVEPKPSASGSAPAALPSPSSSEPPSDQGKSPTSS